MYPGQCNDADVFELLESNVRSYSRTFPATFETAKGAFVYDVTGRRYIDFLSAAGALNYGHNDGRMKQVLIEYIAGDGITTSLDMATSPKRRFLERFRSVILEPRGLSYRVQFTGPTGADAVESALKLARKVKRSGSILSFTGAFHGVTRGALSVTAHASYRHEAFVDRHHASFLPFDGYFGDAVDTIGYAARLLDDPTSGLDRPAAVIVETIQGEGGVNVASVRWLRDLEALCRRFDALLIVDEIQVGCGRSGAFFSFERAGIRPDLVTLSKSISGFGLPMSLVLIRPEIDQWAPGEHTGTFRGNNLAFVTASEALRYWESGELVAQIERKGAVMAARLGALAERYAALDAQVRGIGLIWGLMVRNGELSQAIVREAFARGLMFERCGMDQRVLKFLPPLSIDERVLQEGLDILEQSIRAVLGGV